MNQQLIEFYKGRRENEVHGYSDRLETSLPELPALDKLQRRIDEADKKQDDISARIPTVLSAKRALIRVGLDLVHKIHLIQRV